MVTDEFNSFIEDLLERNVIYPADEAKRINSLQKNFSLSDEEVFFLYKTYCSSSSDVPKTLEYVLKEISFLTSEVNEFIYSKKNNQFYQNVVVNDKPANDAGFLYLRIKDVVNDLINHSNESEFSIKSDLNLYKERFFIKKQSIIDSDNYI
jgi:hypothetical protein